MKSFTSLRLGLTLAVSGFIAGAPSLSFAQDGSSTVFGATGWTQYNLIGNSSLGDGGYDGKSVLNTGMQLSLTQVVSDRLTVKAGVGLFTDNALPRANGGYGSNTYALPWVNPYVYEADLTYTLRKTEASNYWLRAGIFPYTYNPDVKNLGSYLLRGPVYPGLVVSGYERQGVSPVANMTGRPVANITGIQAHHEVGNFAGDFIVSSETQYYPFFDVSMAYVAGYQIHPTLHVGAGVNFYHLISVDPKLTTGGPQPNYNGTKLMATAAFDPKPLLNSTLPFGPEDLRLYGEVGLLGLNDDSLHEAVYGDYLHRMPVMVGFNVPTFTYLDYLSVEVEWYGADFDDDLSRFNQGLYSSLPLTGSSYEKRDDWKWSVQGARTLQKHVQITLQVANDHYRPGIYRGYRDSEMPDRPAFTVTPKDWYTSTKLAFFF